MWNKDRSRYKRKQEYIFKEYMFNAWYENQTGEPPMLKDCMKNKNNVYNTK